MNYTPIADIDFKCGKTYQIRNTTRDEEHSNCKFVGISGKDLQFLKGDESFSLDIETYADYEVQEMQGGGRRSKKTRRGKRSGKKTYRRRR
jgi:hypothetical protein